jgi:hypothetical protein
LIMVKGGECGCVKRFTLWFVGRRTT